MQDEHRQAIRINFSSLVEQTDLDLIVSALYEKGVFSDSMIEPYRDTNKDVRSRKRSLYKDIVRRGPTAFPCLLEALTETGHWDLVRALDPNSVLHPRKEIGLPVKSSNYVSISKNKEIAKTDLKNQQSTSTAKTPYPLDFSKLDKESAEIPQFRVVKSTKFYDNPDKLAYRTRSRQRGLLLAFTFIEFESHVETYRKGAEVDAANLKYLFDQIGFKPLFYQNLTRDEMDETLESLKTNESLPKKECVFVVVSSHGYERHSTSDLDIRCSDGKLISMLDIIAVFNNKNMPLLRNVPKVFIFQTCRGSSDEHVYSVPRHLSAPEADGAGRGAGGGATRGAANGEVRGPDYPGRLYSDILIAHSTLPGFVSYRDKDKGSWYIQCLCEVFAARAHDCHVKQLFALVDERLAERFRQQTSSVDSWGFNKRLYLHPGLFEN